MHQPAVPVSPDISACSGGVPERLRGRVELGFSTEAGRVTRLRRLYQEGSARARLPRAPHGTEAVLINTGGGLTGGDRFSVEVELQRGSRVVVTSQAAEKIYRAAGGEAEVATRLRVAAGARLDWLPQETILFDGARLVRRVEADVEGDGALLLVETTVFGRTARGETVRSGLFRDDWRVRRDGRLAYADSVWVEGDIDAQLKRRATADGALAVGSLVLLAPDAESRTDEVRELVAGPHFSSVGASSWSGLLVSRFLARDGKSLKAGLTRLLEGLRGCPMPRVWSC
jgi:urease accessory protein